MSVGLLHLIGPEFDVGNGSVLIISTTGKSAAGEDGAGWVCDQGSCSTRQLHAMAMWIPASDTGLPRSELIALFPGQEEEERLAGVTLGQGWLHQRILCPPPLCWGFCTHQIAGNFGLRLLWSPLQRLLAKRWQVRGGEEELAASKDHRKSPASWGNNSHGTSDDVGWAMPGCWRGWVAKLPTPSS